jgi:hypothetical protein
MTGSLCSLKGRFRRSCKKPERGTQTSLGQALSFEKPQKILLRLKAVAAIDHRNQETSDQVVQLVKLVRENLGVLAMRNFAAGFVVLLQLLLEAHALGDRDGEKHDHAFGNALSDVPVAGT